jgi:hypothetical protein
MLCEMHALQDVGGCVHEEAAMLEPKCHEEAGTAHCGEDWLHLRLLINTNKYHGALSH